MKFNKKPWPLITIYGIHERINTNPDFQRPAVWGLGQKQLLIDTILREYDVPKLYWRKTGNKPDMYDVVDGQQRLRAIWDFFDGKFKLPKNADPIDDFDIAGCKYENLPDELRMHVDIYPLDIVIIEETDEEEVREMFLRLQNGTTLKAQEKRNAFPGKMRDFVRELAQHPFFTKVGFRNARYTHDLVAAQIICLEIAGEPTNVKNADLNKMYENNKEFDNKSSEARAVNRVLNFLNEVFPEKTPELERFNVISLYCVVAELMKQYVIDGIKPLFQNWVINFEQKRYSQEAKPEDEADPEWVAYKEKISHSTDAGDSIRWRMEFMLRNLLEKYSNLLLKDNQREFTHVQKLVIFRRDKGICKLGIKCGGVKLTWDDWHCDHTMPWSKGGKTTVENGQVSCAVCNLSKNNNII
ncbi:MAG: DUF262 domain-containing protein [Candidatus Omnitrophica bacterium]|nr:DUF262 domain-containing protein [Candidatus Omnitrophota bacterium]